jgi:hypothetical protein
MSGKLSAMQTQRLRHIALSRLRPAAWFSSPTDKSLLRRGLIERCDHTQQLATNVKFVTYLCRLTDAGREALEAR